MELHTNARVPVGLLAAMTLLNEKPHQGVPSWESAPHPGFGFVISSTAIDFQFRCSEIVSGLVVAPNNGKQEPPPPCQAKILNATNNQFGTNYADANVNSTFNYSTGAGPGQGTLNLNITGSTTGVSPGYYPLHWYTYVIGYGSTLHVVSGPNANGGLDSDRGVLFGPNQGTFHIDTGFPLNPVGALFHYLLNFTKLGGYPKC